METSLFRASGMAGRGDDVQNGFTVCLVTTDRMTETFIRAHASGLPAETVTLDGWPPRLNGRALYSQSVPRRAVRRLWRLLLQAGGRDHRTLIYRQILQGVRPAVVLAEYGTTGVRVMDACRLHGVPLVVHFHGVDASRRSVLEQHRRTYPRLFAQATAIIAVSRSMRARLIALGASPERTHYNPCGVDCTVFHPGHPETSPPVFLFVGRFVEKKAPHQLLRSFALVHAAFPEARLRMMGAGPLLAPCQKLATELNLDETVTFLGIQPPEVVRAEMSQARCYVQHSVEATSGDSEGTPVSILEAGACGLPVVSTRHGGIPDVVIEGKTGFLVDEHDIGAMAHHMVRFVRDPQLAGAMGRGARAHVSQHFSLADSLKVLWSILVHSARVPADPRTALVPHKDQATAWQA